MFKYKTGDEVLICAGRDKGKRGKIEKVLPNYNKVVVGGVNIFKRHKKVTRSQPAGIYEVARPIPVSGIAVICPKCSRPTRIGFIVEGETKYRFCRKCQGRLSNTLKQ